MNTLDIAIKHFGSQAELAKAIGVDPMVVYQWKKRRIPPARAVEISRASDGKISPSQLRPDIFGDLTQDTAA